MKSIDIQELWRVAVKLIEAIGENPSRTGIRDTPQRFAAAWHDYTSGYRVTDEQITSLLRSFDDGAENVDEIIVIKNIPVYSHCEHHLAPFFGVAHIGYLPNDKVLGLSKFARLVDVFARRLQIQERLTFQIAERLMRCDLNPVGVGVVLECRHMCMESRGVRTTNSTTRTSAMLGEFRDAAVRAEFFNLTKG